MYFFTSLNTKDYLFAECMRVPSFVVAVWSLTSKLDKNDPATRDALKGLQGNITAILNLIYPEYVVIELFSKGFDHSLVRRIQRRVTELHHNENLILRFCYNLLKKRSCCWYGLKNTYLFDEFFSSVVLVDKLIVFQFRGNLPPLSANIR